MARTRGARTVSNSRSAGVIDKLLEKRVENYAQVFIFFIFNIHSHILCSVMTLLNLCWCSSQFCSVDKMV